MRFTLIIIILLAGISSCSSSFKNNEHVAASDCHLGPGAPDLQAVLDHLKRVVKSQTDLSANSKIELVNLSEQALKNHERLKGEEVEIIRILLSKSIRFKTLSREDLRNKTVLIKRLDKVYKEKETNVLNVIAKLESYSGSSEINESLEKEIFQYLKVIR